MLISIILDIRHPLSLICLHHPCIKYPNGTDLRYMPCMRQVLNSRAWMDMSAMSQGARCRRAAIPETPSVVWLLSWQNVVICCAALPI